MRPARVVAWSLAAVSAALAVLDTVLVAVSVPLLSTESVGIHGWPLVNAASLASAVLGAVIVSSDPRHPIGWLLNFVGVTTCISLAAESYGVWVLEHGGPGSISQGQVGAWIAAVLGGQLALTCITLVFLRGPDGQLPLASVAMGDARCRGRATLSSSGAGQDRSAAASTGSGDPIHVGPVTGILLTGGFLLILLSVLASVACMLLRLRRSHGVARQQLRLVAAGAASVGVGAADPDRRAGVQRRTAVVVVERAAVPGVRLPARLHRRGRAALPALRRRGDPRPGRGARYRDRLRRRRATSGSWWSWAAPPRTGRTAGSGRPCSSPSWWRWRSNRCGAGSSDSPTGWPTGAGRRRTTPWRTSASGSGGVPLQGPCCRRSRRRLPSVVHAERAVVRFDVEGGADLTAVWPSTAP